MSRDDATAVVDAGEAVRRRDDGRIALLLGLAPVVASIWFGDPVYLGPVFYLLAAGALRVTMLPLRAPAFFATGCAAALLLAIAGYWGWAMSLTRSEGLLGLGLVFSLPGLFVAALVAAVRARRRAPTDPVAVLLAAAGACLLGFAINQLVICNTLLACRLP